jgi:hypothetical protein
VLAVCETADTVYVMCITNPNTSEKLLRIEIRRTQEAADFLNG